MKIWEIIDLYFSRVQPINWVQYPVGKLYYPAHISFYHKLRG